MWLWWLEASTTGPDRPRRCSAPCTVMRANCRVSGSTRVNCSARRTARAGHERLHSGTSSAPAGPVSAAAAPPSTSARRSATVFAVANADSSIDVCIRCSSATISSTRSSELSPSSSMLVEASTARPCERRARTASTGSSTGAATASRRSILGPAPDLHPLQLARAFRPRQMFAGPRRHGPDALVIGERRVGRPRDPVEIGPGVHHEHRVHALAGPVLHAHHRRLANARHPVQHPLHIVGEHVEAVGQDDHLLLAAPHVEPPGVVHLADVARAEPPVFEGVGGGLRRVEVALRHVVALHEDLAVGGDFHLQPVNRLADRPAAHRERMIQGDDRRRLRQAVALDDGEAEARPVHLEVRVERRRAHDEGPELHAEQPVHVAVQPPPLHPVHARAGRRGRRRRGVLHVAAEHVEHLRHRHEHRDAPLVNLPDDVVRAEAADEHRGARQHRRDERGHRLAEHVAERQQVEEAQREERPSRTSGTCAPPARSAPCSPGCCGASAPRPSARPSRPT